MSDTQKVEIEFVKAFVVPPPGQKWIIQLPAGTTREDQQGFLDAANQEFAENPPVLICGAEVVVSIPSADE